ncbi:hypothetical protein COCNU_scaffold005154G000020 [Cocos nucifera]|nr:hypothetical protein [Cocos nucifera]
MKGSILPHIIEKMLGHYLFSHSKVANLRQAEASKALQEVQKEVKRVRAEVDHLKVALKIQTAEVEHLQEVLWREEEASTGLRAALSLSEDKRKKAEEEVGI